MKKIITYEQYKKEINKRIKILSDKMKVHDILLMLLEYAATIKLKS